MKKSPDVLDRIIVWFVAAGTIGMLVAIVAASVYSYWVVLTSPGEAPFFAWMLAGCVTLLLVGKIGGFLMKRRLIPEPLIARIERAGAASEGTRISKVGFAAAGGVFCLGVLFGILPGGGGEGALTAGLLFALAIALVTIVMEGVWAFVTDRNNPDRSKK